MRKLKLWLAAAASCAAMSAGSAPGLASDELTIVPFQNVGYWQILSVHEANGRLDHCMATVEYGSGKRVSFNAHAVGGWGFQIHDPSWSPRDLPALTAAITVDDVRLEGVPAALVGRSLFLELNDQELDHIRAGDTILVDTALEIISLQLYKPREATDAAIACRHQFR